MVTVDLSDTNEILFLESYYWPHVGLPNTTAELSEEEAVEIALRNLNIAARLRTKPRVELVILPQPQTNQFFLSWKVFLSTSNPLGDYIYFIHAQNGSILNKEDKLIRS